MKEGWEYKKIGDICSITDFVSNGSFASLKENVKYYNTPNYAVLVRLADASNGFDKTRFVYTDEHGYDFSKKSHLHGGELIMSNVGSVGSMFICPELNQPMTLAPNTISITSKNNRFLYYYFLSDGFKVKLNGITSSTTLKKFNKTNFKLLEITVPPLSEQQSIVDYLDSTFAKIDATKANAEKALNEAKALFQASLKEMLEPKEGWEEKKFGKLCDFVRGPFGGSLKKECFKNSGYAVYEQQNAIYNKFSFRYYIDEEKYKSLIRFKVNPGDLIMSCSGTIGKVAIIPDNCKEGIINQALLKLTPQKEIDANFLKYLMESNYFKEIINANIEGVAIKNIASVAVLKEIKLYIPKVSEQHNIVIGIDSLKSKVDRLQENYEKISQECDALKQAILRQVFE